ncbi:biosynthetic peptidoglycan transglycosylase [Clostridium sp. AM42-4]|uniref:transglycosylase domain-containing protein n=1 Tax=Clostridium sp. AM42-4 TaxID=2292305 RepID=UPI0026CBF863
MMSRMKIAKWMFAFACTIVAGCGFSLAGEGYGLYKNAVEEVSLEEKVAKIRSQENFTSIEELPETYVQAVISVEDHRFYEHGALDPIAIGRALVNDLKAGRYVEGGSTITQQLAKNLYFSQEKTMNRKAAEVFLAFELEQKYTKDEILELYVNSIYFGDGYYSIGEASEGYFGKPASQMNDYEATLLAGVPNAPSRYAPSKNLALAEKRQQKVISRMEACGYLNDQAASVMSAELLALK